jgi:tetratricopeptide (TPR) repeat protein
MAWRAVTAAPDEYLTHHTYAVLLHHAGHDNQALTVVTEALRLQPDRPGAWSLQGAILRGLGRIADSDDAYHQALRLQPDHADSIHDMAINRLRQRRVGAALSGFRGAVRLDPTLGATARTNIALALVTAMRRVTLLATLTGLPIIVATAQTEHHEPAIAARLVVVAAATALLTALIAVARLAPAATWRSTVRLQPFLGYRLTHIVLTLVIAVVTVLATGPLGFIDLAGPAIVAAGLGISFSGRLHQM